MRSWAVSGLLDLLEWLRIWNCGMVGVLLTDISGSDDVTEEFING